MIPKPTEDTITNLLVKELEKYGVKTETFPTISTPSGIRKPDIWCQNGGVYPVEAKFKEGDLVDAIAKVQNEYLKWHDVLGIKGGFALLYPSELSTHLSPDVVAGLAERLKFKAIAMFPREDKRNFTVYEGTLSEIGKILAEHVLTPPEYVEPSTDYIIKALRDAAISITLTLRYLSGKELEALFSGKDVFESILQYEKREYPVEALRLASAYLLINQLLFYHVLSSHTPDRFPEIDTDQIKRPSDVNEYFKTVLNVNYETVFSYDVASRILPGFNDQVKAVINAIKALGPEKIGGDLLGTIFHDLVPFEERKKFAAFYTNVLAAELLAWLSIEKSNAKVADLSVGSGGLLVAAYRRKKDLLESETGSFTQESHKRFVEDELLGVDVMPFAANVAACHLALQSPAYFTNKVNVAIWDSTELLPGRTIPSMASLKFVLRGQSGLDPFINAEGKKKGVVSLGGKSSEKIKLDTYDVTIMNPPFTRQERISEEYKKILVDRFKDYSKYLHGQMGYFGYFVLLADRFLNEDGRMAFVLPATVLHVKSSEGIRKLLSEKYHVEYIITTWHRLAFSESVVFREILLVAKKGKPLPKAITKICVLKRLPDKISKARNVAEKIRKAKTDYEDDEVVVKIHPYSKLTADTTDWHRLISLSDLKLVDFLEGTMLSKKLISLSSISDAERSDLEHFKLGDFHGFVLHDAERIQRQTDQWFLDKVKGSTLITKHRKIKHTVEIPLKCLGRALRRFSHINTIDISDGSDYLIMKWFEKIKEMARYTLSSSELSKLNKEVVEAWQRKFEKKKAHLLFARRLYLSAPGTCLIAFYSQEPTVGIDLWSLRNVESDDAKILALWLNSTLNILQLLYMGVACEGPWMKLHDYMFARLLVPNPKQLTKKERAELLKMFEAMKRTAFPSITEQLTNPNNIRKDIDKAFLEILGCKNVTDKFLKDLYASVLREIKTINELMATEKE